MKSIKLCFIIFTITVFSLMPLIGNTETSKELVEKGREQLDKGNSDKALEYANKAIAGDSKNIDAYLLRGFCFISKKDFIKAIEDFTKSIEIGPNNPELYHIYYMRALTHMYLMGYAFENADEKLLQYIFDKKDYMAIIVDDLDKAIEINQNFSEAYLLRGRAVYSDKPEDRERAFKDFEIACKLGNNEACKEKDINIAGEMNKKGVKACNDGNYNEGLDYMNQAIKHDPNNALYYMNKGNVLHELGKLEEALENLNKAVKLDPDLERVYFNRGNVYKALNQKDKAIIDFRRDCDKGIEESCSAHRELFK